MCLLTLLLHHLRQQMLHLGLSQLAFLNSCHIRDRSQSQGPLLLLKLASQLISPLHHMVLQLLQAFPRFLCYTQGSLHPVHLASTQLSPLSHTSQLHHLKRCQVVAWRCQCSELVTGHKPTLHPCLHNTACQAHTQSAHSLRPLEGQMPVSSRHQQRLRITNKYSRL